MQQTYSFVYIKQTTTSSDYWQFPTRFKITEVSKNELIEKAGKLIEEAYDLIILAGYNPQ